LLLEFIHFFGNVAHYAGQDLVAKFKAGEPWKKVFDLEFIYHNSAPIGDDPFWIWEDAKIQIMNEVQSWPYSFPVFEDAKRLFFAMFLTRRCWSRM
jgi:rhamnogalacturonan endolyase